ncbi:uncharacterized protein OCT59_007880 [Rhizophagus irregularis]|uniref:uncharacterized protein n=1 Tax=Rhizophagus irregularis TaxID=588596 RepID=UPI003318D3CF|nr:hypothetical protein OCT59_007880 [Rhizophagus irregularis]
MLYIDTCQQVDDDFPIEGTEILMNTILSNWILMNLGALKEGVNIWSFRIYLSLESFKHLQTCGTLKSWKQVKDQFRNPKGFGFAEYADADSVLHVLRVLGGEGSGDDKKDKGISCSSCFGGRC